MKRSHLWLLSLWLGACGEAPLEPAQVPERDFILHCQQQCPDIAAWVQARGGEVRHRYRNLPALAVKLPGVAQRELKNLLGGNAIYKDKLIAPPRPAAGRAGRKLGYFPLDAAGLQLQPAHRRDSPTPGNARQSLNNRSTGATGLQARGLDGSGVIVAVIDTGIANNPEVVMSLEGNVIGGESFLEGEEEPGATSTLNDPHGTWVANMIAANASLITTTDSALARAMLTYAPDTVSQDGNQVTIPLLGAAPEASLYALKTFPADGGGAASSTILAAMDRVLTLKNNFLDGQSAQPVAGDGTEDNPFVYDSLDIDVVNLSLGGPTLFAGRELDEVLTEALLKAGVLVVVSAGNEGFAAMTGGAPGTGLGALAVGAAASPVNEKILRELQEGPGVGELFRPGDQWQVASFSSRGPTADGRTGVHLLANGVAVFVQGADGDLGIVSGTSFSAPTVAGIAAQLIQAKPEASARDLRSALLLTGDEDRISGQPSPLDQGFGFVNARRALALLRNEVSDPLPRRPLARAGSEIEDNLEDRGLRVGEVETLVTLELTLQPGQVVQFPFEVEEPSSLLLAVEAVEPELPASEQNALFGDDLLLTLVDAPTSIDDTRLREFINEPGSVEIPHLQPGLPRLALMGDWTNVGDIHVRVSLSLQSESLPPALLRGELEPQTFLEFPLEISAETAWISLQLSWPADWSQYPTHDLDLLLFDPDGEIILDGATLASPERLFVEDPVPGTWILLIDAFTLHGQTSPFLLRGQDQDGTPLSVGLP